MKVVALEDIAEVSAGQGAPQGDYSYGNEGLPFIKAGNLESLIVTRDEYKSCKLVNSKIAKQYKLKSYPKDTLVFAKSGMSAMKGRIYILNNEAYVVNHLATITSNTKFVDPKYLRYFFHVFTPSRLIKDESYPSIGLADIKKVKIPLPSLEDQKNIVKILDQADTLFQKRKQAINLLDDYLKSVFLEMFGDPANNPNGWDVRKISKTIHGGAQNGFFAKNEYYSNSGTPIIWITDFINLPYARVNDLKTVTASNKEIEKYKVAYGDVLFCRSSLTVDGIGKCSIIPQHVLEDIIYECHIIKVSLNKNIIIPEYFRWFSETEFFRNQIKRKAKTSTMTTISQDGVLDISVLIPPIKLQEKFLSFVKKQEVIKQKMLVQSEELETQFQALMQKAFKGEL